MKQIEWRRNPDFKNCECKICCREERIFKTSYETYKNLTAKGEFADGYIKKKP